MNAKRRRDPDGKGLPPFDVIRGEWWSERKLELADMNRRQLESALTDRGTDCTDADLYWLRMRLAREEQVDFHLVRGRQLPDNMIHANYELAVRRPRAIKSNEVDIFRDARSVAREQERFAADIEAAVAREEAGE